MTILILTGPPASGKNSVAPLIARQRERCAVIDVDQVRWMLLQPHAAPWEGEEGKHQCRLGVENACLLAARFAEDNCDVILLDFVWDYTVSIYRERLAHLQSKIVLLMPTLEETLRRNHTRGWLPAHEVEMLYSMMEVFTGYDAKLDNTHLSIEELSQVIMKLWADKYT
jgi:dephospho-CoA kinase